MARVVRTVESRPWSDKSGLSTRSGGGSSGSRTTRWLVVAVAVEKVGRNESSGGSRSSRV